VVVSVQHESAEDLPSTTVVMPTYNRGAAMIEFVKPLLADPFPLEVIVVVDGSEDGSIDALNELAEDHPRLRPIWIANSGEMGARGAGVEMARGEVVLMLDDDVRAGQGLARAHARWHARERGLVVIGYMPTVLSAQPRGRDFATYLYAREYESACRRYQWQPERILHNLWAGNVSLRRADAIEVGLANPRYTYRYHQDREFGLRCLKAGLRGVFDPDLRAEHVHSRGLEAFRREALAQGVGRRRLHELHPDLLGPLEDDEIRKGLPTYLRALSFAGRSPALYPAVTRALVGAIRLTERCGSLRATTGAARLLRRLDLEHGMFGEARA
jgi:glycosyltransferase involved in cell wall biosynthesis